MQELQRRHEARKNREKARPTDEEDEFIVDLVSERRVEEEFSADFVRAMLTKIDWDALRVTASELGVTDDLPQHYTDSQLEDEDFLKLVFHCLVEYHVVEATLLCPKCDARYNVSRGIPDMILPEDEAKS